MPRERLIIRGNQRVAFAGKTNSGKTFMARHLLHSFPRLIAIDPKNVLWKPGWRTDYWSDKGVSELKKGNPARIRISVPPTLDANDNPVWDDIFRVAWDIGDVTVYIDEMYSVCINGRLSWPLRRLYTQGREMGIGVWACTQRPSFVPLEMFSEAEWSFLFMLRMEEDRKRVARAIGDDVLLQPIRDVHGFFMYFETWGSPIYKEIFDPKTGLGEENVEELESPDYSNAAYSKQRAS